MAKAKITFDLSNQDDVREYNLYNNAEGMFGALFEISCNLKKKMRFAAEEGKLKSGDTLDMVFEAIAEILEENNVLIDKLS